VKNLCFFVSETKTMTHYGQFDYTEGQRQQLDVPLRREVRNLNHGEDFDEIIGCINGLFNAKI